MPADFPLSVDNASMYTQPEDIYDIHAALVSRSCSTTERMSSSQLFSSHPTSDEAESGDPTIMGFW